MGRELINEGEALPKNEGDRTMAKIIKPKNIVKQRRGRRFEPDEDILDAAKILAKAGPGTAILIDEVGQVDDRVEQARLRAKFRAHMDYVGIPDGASLSIYWSPDGDMQAELK
jgi:hypothetical protein